MTINSTAIILLALYIAVAKRQGVDPRVLTGTRPERHPQGIRRPRHVHLSAAAVAARRHRHHRVLRARDAAVELDLDQRLPHPRSRLDGGARRWHSRSANACAYVEACLGGRPRRERLRPAPVVLLQRAQQLPGGGREVPRRAAAVGPAHARPVRRDEPARPAAALSHPDGRQHPHRAAAGQQHRARGAAGAGGGARRHAVAACNGRDEALGLPTEQSATAGAADAADPAHEAASRGPSTRSAAPTQSKS